jgi:hypothetical protein
VNVAPHSRIAQEGDLALVRCRVSTDRILGDRVVGLASRQFVPEALSIKGSVESQTCVTVAVTIRPSRDLNTCMVAD